ncbi:MAG: hypothetical protein J6T74_00605 [Clostridia bacterium]|nr:hypothetical protein [Clostridia bacterium]
MYLPKDWKELDKETCEKMLCKFGYCKTINDEQKYITFNILNADFKSTTDKTIKYLEDVKNENLLVDGDPNDENFENTSMVFPIYFSTLKIKNRNAFISISNYAVDEQNYETTCQMMVEKENETFATQFQIGYIDEKEKKVLEKIKNDETFNEVLEFLKHNEL